jgi:hypothetical protein
MVSECQQTLIPSLSFDRFDGIFMDTENLHGQNVGTSREARCFV